MLYISAGTVTGSRVEMRVEMMRRQKRREASYKAFEQAALADKTGLVPAVDPAVWAHALRPSVVRMGREYGIHYFAGRMAACVAKGKAKRRAR